MAFPISSRTIAVTGATGSQGGAVIRALLHSSPTVHLRGITRNPESKAARHLASLGVEVVYGDYDKPDTLNKAFEGCNAAFLVTNFWERADAYWEVKQGKALAAACKHAGVPHVVWSALEDTRSQMPDGAKTSREGYYVPMMDGKSEVSKHLLEQQDMAVTVLISSWYNEDFTSGFFEYHQQEDGGIAFFMPSDVTEKPLPWHSLEDFGRAAAAVLLQGKEAWAGKTVGIVTGYVSLKDCADIISNVTGKTFRVAGMEPGMFTDMAIKAMGPDAGLAKCNLVSYFAHKKSQDERPVATFSQLVAPPASFEDWARQHRVALINALSPAPQP